MIALIYIVTEFVNLFLSALLGLMFIRAILSLFPMDEGSAVVNFVYLLTEPVILPVRMLFSAFGWLEDFPIDIPFFVAVLLLSLLRGFLA